MTDRQLPLEPTLRIDPSTQVAHMPGTDAVCECATYQQHLENSACLWPFCNWPAARDMNATHTEEDT